jgi:hypothetical protein
LRARWSHTVTPAPRDNAEPILRRFLECYSPS